MSAKSPRGSTPTGKDELTGGGHDHLRGPGPSVVGRRERRRVGPAVADRDEIAAAELRQLVLAELIGRLADRAVDGALRQGRGDGRGRVERRPERGQGNDRMPAAVQGRSDQLRHPRIEDDLTTTAIADMQDAGDEPAGPCDDEPARLDREAGWPAVRGDYLEQRRDLSREPLRAGTDLADRQDREPATDVERVDIGQTALDQSEDGEPATDRVAPRVDRAELRADVEVDPTR